MKLVDGVRDWLARRAVRYTCQHVVELLTDYLEGALTTTERKRFEAHLAHCDACQRYLDQLRVTIDVLAHVPVREPDPEIAEELLDFYRNYRAS